ncbi:Thioredoxin-like [bacterium A37T11]|nr:Thioredoxin-like [bacterium A37T11]
MKCVILISWIFPIFAMAQPLDYKGVKFETELTWDQIRAKANKEHKYIFMDCYATWCGPCKKMDKEVYPTDSAGAALNETFIAVKVQMDSAKQDATFIRSWYVTVKEIEKQYNVSALPTYLFFSPNGKLLHRAVGFKSLEKFVTMVNDAVDSEKQLYSAYNKYKEGKLSITKWPILATNLKEAGDEVTSDLVMADYITNYLGKLEYARLFSEDNISLISKNIKYISPESSLFNALYTNQVTVDSLLNNPGISTSLIQHIIYNSYILPLIEYSAKQNSDPDWKMIAMKLYGKYTDKLIKQVLVDAKVRWFQYKKDHVNYIASSLESLRIMELNDPRQRNFLFLNDLAWNIFMYSSDPVVLEKGVEISERAINITPNNVMASILDTKANLLYKLGRKNEAISLEDKVVQMNVGFKKTLDKMKEGKSTFD